MMALEIADQEVFARIHASNLLRVESLVRSRSRQ